MIDRVSARIVAAIGLVALLPVWWFAFGRSMTAGVFSAINILLIIGALYLAMGPVHEVASVDGDHPT